jgi:hypothetical protein
MTARVTAAMLYDLASCPHRVTMDVYGDPTKRDKPNAFVELLWERGSLYEKEVISNLKQPFLDLSRFIGDEKEQRTLEGMKRGARASSLSLLPRNLRSRAVTT